MKFDAESQSGTSTPTPSRAPWHSFTPKSELTIEVTCLVPGYCSHPRCGNTKVSWQGAGTARHYGVGYPRGERYYISAFQRCGVQLQHVQKFGSLHHLA
jgi:hypothetical protein